MARNTSQAVKDESKQEFNKPVELYQVFLDEETLYLTNSPQDVDFFDEDGTPQTYLSIGIDRSDIHTTLEQQSNRVTITIDNVNREFSARLAHQEFRNKQVAIWKVFKGHLESFANRVELFAGVMDDPSVDEQQVELTAYSRIDMYDARIPARKYGTNCPWRFGDPETCGVTPPTASGTVDSVSDFTTLYLSELTGHDDHYWAYGFITVDGESRFVVDSGDGWVRIRIPFFSDPTGENYQLKAGCDKTFGAEDEGQNEINHGCKFWNNTEFFGGFLFIPDDRKGGL